MGFKRLLRGLKRFRIQVTLRILLIAVSIVAFTLFLLPLPLYVTIAIAAAVIIYQVILLIRYVETTYRHLDRFLLSITYDDFSRSVSKEALGPSFEHLFTTFNEILDKFRISRSEKEEQYHYLQTVVQHVGIGLIVFKQDGTVDLINNAAKRLLKTSNLTHIHALGSFSQPLVDSLVSLKSGGSALVKIENEEMELALHAAVFQLKRNWYTLVSLQNIQSELQEKEMEAWQKLIRVLTHEIMNSMTPISSMAQTISGILESLKTNQPDAASGITLDSENLSDISEALKTIHKRSLGLTDFVNTYRNLTLIPAPHFKLFAVEELFSRVEKLMEQRFRENNIRFSSEISPESLEITADPGLIEQVLINLVLNAVDALSEKTGPPERLLRLHACQNETGRIMIRVIDNGPGIIDEARKKLFIPFFTTKKKGSGIGLSLSRQIMKLHKGSISVESEPGVETVFTLKF